MIFRTQHFTPANSGRCPQSSTLYSKRHNTRFTPASSGRCTVRDPQTQPHLEHAWSSQRNTLQRTLEHGWSSQCSVQTKSVWYSVALDPRKAGTFLWLWCSIVVDPNEQIAYKRSKTTPRGSSWGKRKEKKKKKKKKSVIMSYRF